MEVNAMKLVMSYLNNGNYYEVFRNNQLKFKIFLNFRKNSLLQQIDIKIIDIEYDEEYYFTVRLEKGETVNIKAILEVCVSEILNKDVKLQRVNHSLVINGAKSVQLTG